jgi:HlyD family secretion protein
MVETAENVLKVPNAALRFRPSEEMLAQVDMPAMGGGARGAGGDSATRAAARAARQAQGGQGQAGGRQGEGGGQRVVQPGGDGGFGPGGFGGGVRRNVGGTSGGFAMLWYLDDAGKVAVMPVRTGISDGTTTQIQGPDVKEGMQVIAGLTQTDDAAGAVNPFQGGGQNRGGFRPGGF